MKIGLIDVDGRHGKKKWGATIYPNVALGKIARWHTMRGDEVEWAQPTDLFDRHHYDILYASKVFNFSPDIDFRQFSYDRLEKGGTGYDIYKRLPDEIDRIQPLYELFPWVPKNHAYGKLTEGCPNKCFWCVVPKKEGFIRPYMDIEEIAIGGRTHVVLMDNNILAAGDYAKEQLEKIIRGVSYRLQSGDGRTACHYRICRTVWQSEMDRLSHPLRLRHHGTDSEM